jgi:murein DD-endopeptidase / murein LD-carboxypeptidase
MPDQFAQDFVAAARLCLGARFRLQGRQPETGLDCIGLIIWSAKRAGLVVPDAQDYLLSDNPARLDAGLLAAPIVPIDPATIAAGDIVRLLSNGQPLHLAICGSESLIHADIKCRKVVEQRLTPAWREQIVAAYRFER